MDGWDGNGDRGGTTTIRNVTVGDLADAIETAANEAGMNQTALQRATGLSARTVHDLLTRAPGRRYTRTTLDKLDEPLGWEPGTAWRLHRQPPQHDDAEQRIAQLVRLQMEGLAARVAILEEQPSWADEVLDVFRPLRPEVRAILLDLGRRLGPSA